MKLFDWHLELGLFVLCLKCAKSASKHMHLSTEELPASWTVKVFGEVGGGVPEYFSSGEVFQ